MITGILIIAFSLALLTYWFRYSCILLLRNYQDAPAPAVADNRFQAGEVQTRLREEADLDPLHRSLQRDYAMLAYLVEHAAGLELNSIEDKLLVLDYKLMQGWYRVTRGAAPQQARQALGEMASIVQILSSKLESAGVRSEG